MEFFLATLALLMLTPALTPLFQPDDRYRIKPGEKAYTVGFEYPNIPKASNILDTLS